MIEGKLFITGGAGTLGKAIIKRAKDEEWPCDITVYSRDPMKHHELKKEYPDVTCVVGDIADSNALWLAMAGHDVVIHAAAMKHIPEAEQYPVTAYEVNVSGSLSVLSACVYYNIKHVVGISTDKACHPVNAYGCTKMMMERAFQQHAEAYPDIAFHLVRYGNVLGSTGSFIPVWRAMLEEHGKVYATDPDMTRFWLTVEDAVNLILFSLKEPSGTIAIPMAKSLSMKKMAEYVLPENAKIEYHGLRPGEKRHEELLTVEEEIFVAHIESTVLRLFPVQGKPVMMYTGTNLTSENAKELTKEEILEMIGE